MSGDMIEMKKDLSAQELALVTLEMDRQKKHSTTMWLLWFFAGGFGGHRYYLGDKKRAIAQTAACVLAFIVGVAGIASANTVQDVEAAVGIMYLLFLMPAIWALVDAFLISRRLQEKNAEIEAKIVERIRSMRAKAGESA